MQKAVLGLGLLAMLFADTMAVQTPQFKDLVQKTHTTLSQLQAQDDIDTGKVILDDAEERGKAMALEFKDDEDFAGAFEFIDEDDHKASVLIAKGKTQAELDDLSESLAKNFASYIAGGDFSIDVDVEHH
eukprot:403335821